MVSACDEYLGAVSQSHGSGTTSNTLVVDSPIVSREGSQTTDFSQSIDPSPGYSDADYQDYLPTRPG